MLLPSHIAIIMDGNRRWARGQGLPEIKGHQQGADNLERIAEYAAHLGIKTLTVYALSTENLERRARRELQALFKLLIWGFTHKVQKLVQKGVRVNILGNISQLPRAVQDAITSLKQTYIQKDAFVLNIALNYGGKQEIVHALKKLIASGIDVDKLNEDDISRALYTGDQSEPDLIIRTGGQVRLSNFLLWQSAYSELYFSPILWPDFKEKELDTALTWWREQKKNRGK